ncbi:MAG: helix-hairpin-helix domain-containing protein, partial [Candidatus Omnitrophota bacterium]
MKNLEIAAIFSNIADLLEIKNENPFRIRAYRKASQTLEDITKDIAHLAEKNEIIDLPGIGKDLAGKIDEYLLKGKIKFYEDLKKGVPKTILDLLDIPGVGPKTAKLLSERLRLKSIKDLEKKAASGKIANIPGIKEKTVANILRGIEFLKKSKQRRPLDGALNIAENIISLLKKLTELKSIAIAGSLRRMRETVRDIDILAVSN